MESDDVLFGMFLVAVMVVGGAAGGFFVVWLSHLFA